MLQQIAALHWLAALAAIGAHFLLGALWFAPFAFGKAWSRGLGFNQPAGWKAPASYYVGPLLGSIVAGFATAAVMQALQPASALEAGASGLLLGAGYAASASFVNALAPTIPRPYLYGAVTGAYHACGIALAAIVYFFAS